MKTKTDKGTEKKQRKKKAPKDEDAPKRGKSAFLHYISAKQEEYKKEHTSLSHKEVISKLSELWNNLSDKEKAPYNLLADKDKERFQKEKQAYIAKKAEEGGHGKSEPDKADKKLTSKRKADKEPANAPKPSKKTKKNEPKEESEEEESD